MDDLDLVLAGHGIDAGDHQARVGEACDEGLRRPGSAPAGTSSARPTRRRVSRWPPRRRGRLEAGEAHEDVPDALLVVRRKRDVQVVRGVGDRLPHAADGAVLAGQQPAPVAPLPELEERLLEQRHRARLARDLVEDGLGEVRLEAQADRGRVELHRPPQLGGIHRPDQLLVRLHRRAQGGIGGAFAPEVGAHRDHHAVPGRAPGAAR